MVSKITMQVIETNISVRGRLAPSPTGFLHLGNAWAFLMAWLMVRKSNGTLVLRMEDIDTERSKESYAQAIVGDLSWLGLDWDEGYGKSPFNQEYMQSTQYAYYETILDILKKQSLLYPCFCSRKELRSLMNAPHAGENFVYPETCKKLSHKEQECFKQQNKGYSLRFSCPWKGLQEKDCASQQQEFTDMFMGQQSMSWNNCGGDVPLMRSDNVVAYQLAVVADDIRMNINQVVRGNDILPSTIWQMGLYEALQVKIPEYGHVALLCDEEGERFAKRHQSVTLQALREQGVKPQAIIALLARAGKLMPMAGNKAEMTLQELLAGFQVDTMPEKIIITHKELQNLQKN